MQERPGREQNDQGREQNEAQNPLVTKYEMLGKRPLGRESLGHKH